MNLWKETLALIRRDLVLEWRTKYAISGILLYVLATVVVVYSALVSIDPRLWNALFWVIILFAAISAVVKSFVQESSERQLYYYSLVNPIALLLAKMIYNTGLLLGLSLLTWLLLGWLVGNPVKDYRLFGLTLLAGCIGLSVCFTFIAAISAKAGNSATLMSVLSFPLVVPILLTLVQLGLAALRLQRSTDQSSDLVILSAIDLLLLGAAIILYPFLWRD